MINIKYGLGQVIRKYRKEQKLSQEKFALQIGMDRTYLVSVEKGQRNISIDNIYKIVSGLNMTLSDFFKAVDKMVENTDGNARVKKES